ncbi:hypothetical protein DFP72DRAFT_793194, partial [Ephemerocybe angulata]
KLLQAYNAAVQALKVFRDKHMIIVALYITWNAETRSEAEEEGKEVLKGTGGTDLVRFLKSVRE